MLPPWLSILTALVVAGPGFGHDLYLEPSTFRPEVGQPVAITIGVGHAFAGSPLPYTESLVESFGATGPDGLRRNLGGIEGVHPAALLRFDQAGKWQVVYHGHPWLQRLPAARFEAYLAEVGRLDLAVSIDPSSPEPVIERVHRCARSVIEVAGARESTLSEAILSEAERPSPCSFDIVPVTRTDTSPCLVAQVLRNGVPVSGARVMVWRGGVREGTDRRDPPRPRLVESDDNGLVEIDVAGGGRYVLASVSLAALDGEATDGARFESWWATLSFDSEFASELASELNGGEDRAIRQSAEAD